MLIWSEMIISTSPWNENRRIRRENNTWNLWLCMRIFQDYCRAWATAVTDGLTGIWACRRRARDLWESCPLSWVHSWPDLADSCALHFVHPASIWRPLCVKVKSDRTHPVLLLHVSQFHPQSRIIAMPLISWHSRLLKSVKHFVDMKDMICKLHDFQCCQKILCYGSVTIKADSSGSPSVILLHWSSQNPYSSTLSFDILRDPDSNHPSLPSSMKKQIPADGKLTLVPDYIWIERVTLEICNHQRRSKRSVKPIDTKSSKSCALPDEQTFLKYKHMLSSTRTLTQESFTNREPQKRPISKTRCSRWIESQKNSIR